MDYYLSKKAAGLLHNVNASQSREEDNAGNVEMTCDKSG